MLCRYSNTTTSFLKSNYIAYILICPPLKTKKIVLIFSQNYSFRGEILQCNHWIGRKINSCIRNWFCQAFAEDIHCALADLTYLSASIYISPGPSLSYHVNFIIIEVITSTATDIHMVLYCLMTMQIGIIFNVNCHTIPILTLNASRLKFLFGSRFGCFRTSLS